MSFVSHVPSPSLSLRDQNRLRLAREGHKPFMSVSALQQLNTQSPLWRCLAQEAQGTALLHFITHGLLVRTQTYKPLFALVEENPWDCWNPDPLALSICDLLQRNEPQAAQMLTDALPSFNTDHNCELQSRFLANICHFAHPQMFQAALQRSLSSLESTDQGFAFIPTFLSRLSKTVAWACSDAPSDFPVDHSPFIPITIPESRSYALSAAKLVLQAITQYKHPIVTDSFAWQARLLSILPVFCQSTELAESLSTLSKAYANPDGWISFHSNNVSSWNSQYPAPNVFPNDLFKHTPRDSFWSLAECAILYGNSDLAHQLQAGGCGLDLKQLEAQIELYLTVLPQQHTSFLQRAQSTLCRTTLAESVPEHPLFHNRPRPLL